MCKSLSDSLALCQPQETYLVEDLYKETIKREAAGSLS